MIDAVLMFMRRHVVPLTLALLVGLAAAGATTSASAAASPSPSASASPTGAPQPPPPQLTAAPTPVRSGGALTVRVSGVEGTVELHAADRGSDAFRLIRSETPSGGGITFTVYPDRHKRLYAREMNGRTANGGMSSVVDVTVYASVGIAAVRNGARDYTFRGTVMPAAGGTVVSLFRVDPKSGRLVLSGRAPTSADGRYSIRRAFLSSGRFEFVTTTAATAVADAGQSPRRPTAVY